jgi:hypothetical protein
MRAKQALTLLLAGFVIVAIAVVVIGDSRQDAPEGTPVVAAAVVPGNPAPAETPEPMPVTSEPEVSSEMPEPTAAPAPPKAVASSPEPVKAVPVAAKAEPPASVAVVAPQPESHKVVATYFHGNVRCATCRKVETYAREAVEEGFRSEIEAGVVEFRAINVEEPANRHYIQDYQLMTRSVVVTEEVDGAVAQWTRLDQVWTFVGNRPAYLNYVQDAVRGYLELH